MDAVKINEMIWENCIDIPVETQELVLSRIKFANANPDTMLDWDKASKTLVP